MARARWRAAARTLPLNRVCAARHARAGAFSRRMAAARAGAAQARHRQRHESGMAKINGEKNASVAAKRKRRGAEKWRKKRRNGENGGNIEENGGGESNGISETEKHGIENISKWRKSKRRGESEKWLVAGIWAKYRTA